MANYTDVVSFLDVKFTESRRAVGCSHRDRGFSFVELLVVIAILGALITVTLLAVRGIADRGRETACTQDRRVVTTAIESYFATHRVDHLPGLPPVDGNEFERGLVSAAVIHDVSVYYDVAVDGSLIPESGSPCS